MLGHRKTEKAKRLQVKGNGFLPPLLSDTQPRPFLSYLGNIEMVYAGLCRAAWVPGDAWLGLFGAKLAYCVCMEGHHCLTLNFLEGVLGLMARVPGGQSDSPWCV